ncbi:MAG: orotidine-5'-phosphate decarboxylase [Pyrinomonadaceae bacterium]
MEQAKAKLIVALDVETAARARELVEQLQDSVGMFKIGLQLFTAAGPGIVRELADIGVPIFLDLKFHDIPQTVARAGTEAARLGVFMFNVHAAGGGEMMRRTIEAVNETAEKEGRSPTKVIGVTVLTSLDQSALTKTGVMNTPLEQVLRLAELAQNSGLQGVVSSAVEAAAVRRITGKSFLLVTPGVRPAGAGHDDQARVFTPGAAIEATSDYLVVGRPITDAPNPVHAAHLIVEEIKRALDGSDEHNFARSGR